MAAATAAQRDQDRTGTLMEVQGCGEDCDFVCSICEWEACTIEKDHGRCCDIRILSDEELVAGVVNRHLRLPAAAGAKRRGSRS